jgi:hypothetical protein
LARAEIEKVGIEQAYRCNSCGCVYLRDVHRNRILGRLDNYIDRELTGKQWVSQNYP